MHGVAVLRSVLCVCPSVRTFSSSPVSHLACSLWSCLFCFRPYLSCTCCCACAVALSFYIYNTHFDHQSQNARLKSSQLIAERINNRRHKNPFVVTGDFNADESNPVILYLKRKSDNLPKSPIVLVDSFRQLHPNAKSVGTGGGFKGLADVKKIDYAFVQPETKVVTASIIRTNRDGRYPSDHSPVMAEIQLSTNQQNTR